MKKKRQKCGVVNLRDFHKYFWSMEAFEEFAGNFEIACRSDQNLILLGDRFLGSVISPEKTKRMLARRIAKRSKKDILDKLD